MNKVLTLSLAGFLALTGLTYANNIPGTAVAKILTYKTSLGLTDSQVKKLEVVDRTAQAKIAEARFQASIRLAEIEKFTSNWTNMNSLAVMSLVKEYYNYMQAAKAAELDAIIKARAILDMTQLNKFQQLVSIESLMLNVEQDLASR
jgi:hypothetical protein